MWGVLIIGITILIDLFLTGLFYFSYQLELMLDYYWLTYFLLLFFYSLVKKLMLKSQWFRLFVTFVMLIITSSDAT